MQEKRNYSMDGAQDQQQKEIRLFCPLEVKTDTGCFPIERLPPSSKSCWIKNLPAPPSQR